MRETLQDLRFAFRLLRKSPGFTAVAVAILALGLGANTAIFTLVNRVMLRPLPYPRPGELMALSLTASGPGTRALASGDELPFSYPKFRTLLDSARSFTAIAGFSDDEANLTGAGNPERIRIEFVTGRYFDVLEIRPRAGRFLAGADDAAGAAPAIVVSSDLAEKYFGSPSGAVGKVVSLNGVAATVAGVAPVAFAGAGGTGRAWVPMALAPAMKYSGVLSEPGDHWFQAVGRRRPGVSEAAAREDIALAGKRVALAHPTPARYDDGSVWGAAAIPFADARRDPMLRRALAVLLAAVGGVLLLASGNLAALVVARGAARRHEIAVRVALGASPGRIRRQLLAESMLLAALGGAAGIGTAILGTRALVAMAPPRVFDTGISASELLELSQAALDGRVLAFTCLLALGAGVLIGMVPAWRAARLDPGEALKSSGRTTASSRRGRSILAGAEIAVSLVLLLGGGLLVRSLLARYRVPLGFRSEGVVTFSITPSSSGTSPGNALLHDRLVRAITAVAGVESAAIDVCSPLSAGCNRTHVKRVDGIPIPPGKRETIGVHLVTPGYFRTLGIPLRRGRGFSAGDKAGAPRVAIVNETAARRIWPGRDPVGRRIELGMGDFKDGEQAEVVGVVGDVHYGRVESAPIADAYLPDPQIAFPDAAIAARTQGDPSTFRTALTEAVRRVDPNLPISEWRTLRERVSGALAAPRFAAALLSGFALFAVLLAALGIYGLLAQIAAERAREIGIRIALGARPSDVFGMMLRWGALVAAGGIAAGLVLFAPVSRALGALLFDVPPSDPATIASVVLFLGAVAVAASLAPARRASRIDPVDALRQS